MKKLCLFLLLVTISLAISSCTMPVSYYTNPNSAGYNQQKLGGICEHCGRQFNISGNQLHNIPQIKCPYCGNLSNTKNSAAKWVQIKPQIEQQANQQILLGILQGTAAGLNSYNNARQTSSANSYQSSGSAYTVAPDRSYNPVNNTQRTPSVNSYQSSGSSYKMTPDGSYVGGDSYKMAPDGSYVGGDSYKMAPDGSYVGGDSYKMAPDGSYVGQ